MLCVKTFFIICLQEFFFLYFGHYLFQFLNGKRNIFFSHFLPYVFNYPLKMKWFFFILWQTSFEKTQNLILFYDEYFELLHIFRSLFNSILFFFSLKICLDNLKKKLLEIFFLQWCESNQDFKTSSNHHIRTQEF